MHAAISGSAGLNWRYVGAGSIVSGTTTAPLPTDSITGDLLILVSATGNTATAPTGWTEAVGGGGTPKGNVFYKFRAASEPDPTVSSTSGMTHVVVAYRNINLNGHDVFSSAVTNSVTSTSLTTTTANDLVVTIWWSEKIAGTYDVAPTGTTERTSYDPTGTRFGVFIADENLSAAGATTARTLAFSSGAPNTANFTMSFVQGVNSIPSEVVSVSNAQNASNTVTIPKPAGLAVGDLMVAFLANGPGDTWSNTISFTEAIDQAAAPGLCIAYKVATSGDVAAANFLFTRASASNTCTGQIVAIRGGTYYSVGSVQTTGTGRSCSAPSVTAAGSRSLVFAFFGGGNNPYLFSTPSGYSYVDYVMAVGTSETNAAIFCRVLDSGGASGAANSTTNADVADAGGVHVAITLS